MRTVIAVLLLVTLALAYDPIRSYAGSRLVKITTKCPGALQQIQNVVDSFSLDVWSNEGRLVLSRDNDILLPPQAFEQLTAIQHKHQSFSMTVANEDIQGLLDEFKTLQNSAVENGGNDDFFVKYRTYDEIMQFTKDLQQQYASITKLVTVGSTWENREIHGLIISTNGNQTKPTLLLDGYASVMYCDNFVVCNMLVNGLLP